MIPFYQLETLPLLDELPSLRRRATAEVRLFFVSPD